MHNFDLTPAEIKKHFFSEHMRSQANKYPGWRAKRILWMADKFDRAYTAAYEAYENVEPFYEIAAEIGHRYYEMTGDPEAAYFWKGPWELRLGANNA